MVKENQNEVEILQSVQNYFEEQRLKYLENLSKKSTRLTQRCLVYNEFMNKVFKEAQEGRHAYLMSLIEESIRSLAEVDKIYGHVE